MHMLCKLAPLVSTKFTGALSDGDLLYAMKKQFTGFQTRALSSHQILSIFFTFLSIQHRTRRRG